MSFVFFNQDILYLGFTFIFILVLLSWCGEKIFIMSVLSVSQACAWSQCDSVTLVCDHIIIMSIPTWVKFFAHHTPFLQGCAELIFFISFHCITSEYNNNMSSFLK